MKESMIVMIIVMIMNNTVMIIIHGNLRGPPHCHPRQEIRP